MFLVVQFSAYRADNTALIQVLVKNMEKQMADYFPDFV